MAAFCVGGPFGAVLAGKWADAKGRKKTALLTAWFYVVGGLAQTFAPTLSVVIVARTIVGLGCGMSTVMVPIYLGELAPPRFRGAIGTMAQFSFVFGILFADVVAFRLANETQWRYMFLLISALGVFHLLLNTFLLESPRWLLGRDPSSDDARVIIRKLRGFENDGQVESEVRQYAGASRKLSRLSITVDDITETTPTAELFADKKVRLQLVSSLVLQVASQLSG